MELDAEKIISKLLQRIAELELENAKLSVAFGEKNLVNEEQGDE
ncbi:hypothetical protein [Enterococcus caccae]|uniref:Uncharacterized protein n=1 Tax=Enterococcus caccae ATCC BAA-1240 TaxID=1158612 RepID=R3WD54_9ENTE|nr:hypothetical protein [Enterococcus caccae]EOL45826.1 hypothetical protein UC7_01623 [Enterococcus caccae ATCC BAA-1240]EOT61022.1 hypothetical protein I580_01924 [Enterococcus caccae ATCC BAA-1240]OJG27948.1 hypothetical protein RU98_GL002157 [Enterococcus caccae]